MNTHHHTDACCNDCGGHTPGTCAGCDHRARNKRQREARKARAGVPFVDVQHESCGDDAPSAWKLPRGTQVAGVCLPGDAVVEALEARSARGLGTVWAGPGATRWYTIMLDDNAVVGELRRAVVAPGHVAELCDACILRTMPRAMDDDDALGGDRERDEAGRYVWSHAEWTDHVPHAEDQTLREGA